MIDIKKLKEAGLTDSQITTLLKPNKKNNDIPTIEDVLYLSTDDCGNTKITGVKCNYIAKYLSNQETYIFATAPESEKGFVFKYDKIKGVYISVTDMEVKSEVKNFLENYAESIVRTSKIDEIFALMKQEMKKVLINSFNQNYSIINFKNGILKINTLELVPHSPDYLCNIQIPVNWNNEFVDNPSLAESKVFDAYLSDLTALKSEKDAADTKKLLLEYIGVIMSNVPGWRFKKALLTFGKGNSGKTQIRNFAINLIGENNTAVVELEDLESREGPSRAYRKRIIGSGDMKYGTAGQIATFKNITGGESTSVRYLYKEAFSAKIDGLFWYGANTLPLFGGDKGQWVYDRIIPVRCDNVIPEEKRDPELLDKMLAEKEAIVYKAIIAMRDVVERGYKFTIPQCSKDDLKAYQSENNIVLEFFEDYCTTKVIERKEVDGETIYVCTDKDIEISTHSKVEIKKAFTNWAKANYNVIPTKHEFESAIAERLGCDIKDLDVRTSKMRAYAKFDITRECARIWLRTYADVEALDDKTVLINF